MNIRSIRILFLLALTMVVVAACDQGKTLEGTSTHLGSIQGRVTEGTPETASTPEAATTTAAAAPSRQAQAQLPSVDFGKGLPGVRVTVFLKGQLKTTKTSLDNPKTTDVDEGGYFTIPGLPAGVLLPVTFDRPEYVTLNGNIEIPAVAGSGDSAIPLKDPVASIEIAMVKGKGSASLNIDRLVKFKGLLQGIVVDGTPGADRGKALGDVTISLFVGGTVITTKSKTNDEKTTFDETGFFSISNLPPGQPISATFEKAEYQKTRITVTVPVAQGTEDPAVNVEVKLVKGDITKIIEDTLKPLPFNGTIQGIIRDGTVAADTFGMPLSGVTVAALVLGRVVETSSKEDDPRTPGFDETGFFALNNLPINIAIPVRFKAEGYVAVTTFITIPDPQLSTQGEQETAQVTYDIDLVKDSASLLVVVYAGKGPANGATVVLDLTNVSTANLSNSTGVMVSSGGGFEVRQVKTTDANGQVTFDKLPPIIVPGAAIVVQPFDEDKGTDKLPDYKTTTAATVGITSVDLRQLTSGAGPNVVRINLLTSGPITPAVIWSNVVDNTVLNKDDILKFIFDLPMDTMPVAEVKDPATGKVTTVADPKNASFAVTLTDPDSQPVPFKATWKDNVTLEVDPFSDLQPTNKANFDPTNACGSNCYTVSVRARSIQGVFVAAYSRSFKVTEKAAALTSPSVGAWPTGSPTAAPTQIDWSAVSLNIQWSADPGAINYNVYLKDNRLNQDWVRATTAYTYTSPQGDSIVATLEGDCTGAGNTNTIPAQFDKYQTDGAPIGGVCAGATDDVEPLAFGGTITIAVTTVNRDGIESAIENTKTVTFRDNKPPDIATTAGAGLKVARSTGASNFCFDTVAATSDTQVLVPPVQTGVTSGTTADNSTAANCPQGTLASCTSAKILRIRLVNFLEPMGGGGSASVLNTTTAATGDCAGGTTSNTTDPSIAAGPVWVETSAGQGNQEIYVDVSIPAGKSAVGDCIRIALDGVTDVAGNQETQIKPDTNPSIAIVDGRCKSQGDVFIYKLY